MNNGWIKLHRKLLENPIMLKPNYLSIWLYLLLRANHEDKFIIWNNKKTLIKKGSFIGSLRGISKHYGISIGTVKYVVDYFVSEQMIEHKPNNKFSLFIIKKWKDYQIIEHQTEHKLNTSRTLAETNNNYKNEKNEKKYNIADKSAEDKNQVQEIFKIFYEINPTINFGNTTQRKAVKELIDKFGFDKLKATIQYSCGIQGQPYSPVITTPLAFKNKLGDLIAFEKRNKSRTVKI